MSTFISEKDELKAIVAGALFRHKKDLYDVKVKELLPAPWPGKRQRVAFRRAADTANGNFKKLRRKLVCDFLAEFFSLPVDENLD